jgi:uncharacterized cupredoxin-like copper-binding protein
MARCLVTRVTVLLMLSGCADVVGENTGAPSAPSLAPLPGVDWSQAEVVVVRLIDYRFEPADLTLQHGKVYRLRLENVGRYLHEFTAPQFFDTATVRDAEHVLAFGQEVVVQPGEARDVDVVAPEPGTYELRCADHDWAGMIGRIIVR